MGMKEGKCHTLCVVWGVGRYIFLVSMMLISLGFIVEMMLLGTIIVPYLLESAFSNTSCQFNNSYYKEPAQSCQDPFFKRTSSFPCLVAIVGFQNPGSPSQRVYGNIYGRYSYYKEATTAYPCASRICYTEYSLNHGQISNLNMSVYARNLSFPCWVKLEASGQWSVLFSREFTDNQIFHCILWPVLFFGLGLLLVWVVYMIAGCSVWDYTASLA